MNTNTNCITNFEIIRESIRSKKTIMYKNSGKPTYWFKDNFIWELQAEEVRLDWFYR
ncbi:hypothetical protein [uncultured Clostridium sp.]|uniref:hypothetical protein n=1 Tax=uncultured Clostridium sp. TaxID=59620 RepID=UPI00272AAAAE|nr:hypothetical protein [uncultured Clostridium sp.]